MPSPKDQATTIVIAAGLVGGIVGVAVYTALAIFSIVVSGGVLAVLWSWFIAPTLTTYQLPWAQAIGVMLTVRYIWPLTRNAKENSGTLYADLFERTIRILVSAGVALALGWITKSIF